MDENEMPNKLSLIMGYFLASSVFFALLALIAWSINKGFDKIAGTLT